MRQPWTQLYVHLVWSTWKRAPLITPELQRRVYAGIQHQASLLGADVIAIGGVADHVHVLARFPARVAISDLVKRMKAHPPTSSPTSSGLREHSSGRGATARSP